MKLIIAEKPSLGRNIANAIGAKKREDGYLIGNNYIVTWAFGHIYQLKEVDDYLGEKKKWHEVALPFIPEFEYKVPNDSGMKKQIKIINELARRSDVEEIVNAGDADREGQLIVNNIIKRLGVKKKTTRLWLPEQTEETIKKQVNLLENNSLYDNLEKEGLARTYIDWLYGINLTRYITVKTGELVRTGRVIVPIVEAIYNRDMEILNFQSKDYLVLESNSKHNGSELKLILNDIKYDVKEEAEAQAECDRLNLAGAIVGSVSKKEVKKTPPKLFSLTTLQSKLSKDYNITNSESLEIIQSLYEKGNLTYPRTNTEYLAVAEKENIKELIGVYSDFELEFKDSERIFNDEKIESHSAILITKKEPTDLNEKELLVYNTVLNRFLANFCNKDCVVDATEVSIKIGNKLITLKGESIKNEGFLKYEKGNIKNELPNFEEGDKIEIDFRPSKKKTSPPKKLNESSLASYLENPFRKDLDEDEVIEEKDDTEDYKEILKGTEIGTVATRTGIIENCKSCGYISQKRSVFSITEKGIRFIENLKILNINLFKEKTVKIQQDLKKVYKNELTIEEIVNSTKEELKKIISQKIEFKKAEKESFGICPWCGKNVIETKIAYSCEGYKDNPPCKFNIWKNNKWFESKGKKLNKTIAKQLIKDGKAYVTGFKSKKGTDYSATVIIKKDEKYGVQFELGLNK